MQIKTEMSYYLIPVRMTTTKSIQRIIGGNGVEQRKPSNTIAGNVIWYNHYWEKYEGYFIFFLKVTLKTNKNLP